MSIAYDVTCSNCGSRRFLKDSRCWKCDRHNSQHYRKRMAWKKRNAAARKFKRGDEVVWLLRPHGGYGYIFRIPGVVVENGRVLVKIEVCKANGEKVVRKVKEESLLFGGL